MYKLRCGIFSVFRVHRMTNPAGLFNISLRRCWEQ
nr:MAG TPA: hypothetical protein [Caudoviricetes sp.]